MLLVLTALLAMQAFAVKNYQRCFQCFHENREGYAFCGDTGECLSNLSQDCEDEWITTYFDCPNKYENQNCANYTFTNETFGMSGENAEV